MQSKEDELYDQIVKLQIIVDFYRDDWKAMIKQLEEAEERAAYWHDEYVKSVMGSNVKV
jgi:hypothetical protein